MTLTDSDLSAIEAIVDRQLNAFRASPVLPPVPLPTKLTLGEFAWCVQRNRATVAKRRVLNRKFAQYCEGRRPVLIHPEALALWGVDPGLAAERLRQLPVRSSARSTGRAQRPAA